jgi:hypothetical protein
MCKFRQASGPNITPLPGPAILPPTPERTSWFSANRGGFARSSAHHSVFLAMPYLPSCCCRSHPDTQSGHQLSASSLWRDILGGKRRSGRGLKRLSWIKLIDYCYLIGMTGRGREKLLTNWVIYLISCPKLRQAITEGQKRERERSRMNSFLASNNNNRVCQ